MLDLSVIIISFNTKEVTLKCLDSLFKERSVPKKEIIVVDNASNDSSLTKLRTLYKRTKIKLIESPQNYGFARAVNQGIKRSRGKYILLLNSDTVVKKGALDLLVEFAESDPAIGVIGAKLLNPDSTVQPSVFRFPTIMGAMRHYWLGEKGLLDKYYPKGDRQVEVDAVVGAAFLITPSAKKNVGLLDDRYFMYYEDIDYCRKVKKAGLKVYYLPQAEVIHYHGQSGTKLKKNKDQWRRLIPSSKIYHGLLKHYFINFIIWSGQKWQRILAYRK